MSDNDPDIFATTDFGRVAYQKLQPLPEGFRIYRAEWLGKRVEESTEMRLTGRQFTVTKRGKSAGMLNTPVPRTIRSVIVTKAEAKGAATVAQPKTA